MSKVLGIICVIGCLIAGGRTASSLEELQLQYMEILKECMSEYPLTPSDIEVLGNGNIPDNQNIDCFFACAFKKTGMMDDKGNFSVEGVRQATEKYYPNEPEIIRRSQEFTDACKSVNDVPTGDGNKGCERGRLIYQCSTEKAHQEVKPNFILDITNICTSTKSGH